MRDRHTEHLVILVADHLAKASVRDQLHRVHAEARSKNSIERRGRTAALEVTEHAATCLLVRPRGNLRGDAFANPAELVLTGTRLPVNLPAILRMSTFRHNHHCAEAALVRTQTN